MTGNSERPVVLVVSEAEDHSAEAVTAELAARGVANARVDTSDFPQRMRFAASLDDGWDGRIRVDGADVELKAISAVYYRRPKDFDLPAGLTVPERRFAHTQARVGVGGVLASLPARWISHPSAIADNEYKPRQLDLLRRCGLTVPRTLVTNDPDAVRTFAAEVGDMVIKPLAEPIVWEAGGESVLYTRRLSAADLDDLTGIDATAHLLQLWVPKQYECRVTVVGDQHVFAVAIHASSEESYLDWRSDYSALRYEVIDCPPDIRGALHRYLDAAGLAFGTFDFVVGPTGSWTVLECNASGQWGWLAEELGLPIAAAIAEELTKE